MATKTDRRTEQQVLRLLSKGMSSREVALKVLGSITKKSTVNDIRGRHAVDTSIYSAGGNEPSPKILLIDIETSAAIVGAFQRWDVNVSQQQVFQEVALLGFCAKWIGDHDMVEVYPTKFKDWSGDKEQRQMLDKAWKLLDTADFVIGHNLNRFDAPMLNAQFVKHGYDKPSPYKRIDTLRIAKANFRFPSNSLDSLGEYLQLGRKTPNSGFKLWRGCMLGESDSFREMIEYNNQDVVLLESVYMALRGWDSTHPNISFHYEDDSDIRCGVCGSVDLQDTGKKAYTNASEFSLYKCSDCGSWHRTRKRNKRNSETLVGVK